MNRVAIVVLNYLNYKDTIECVDSILKMHYQICGVVIVENGSHNESYVRLKSQYENQKLIQIIASKKNLGYARGNNLGIKYARNKLRADFVLVVNNDTVFIEKNYIEILLNKYEPGVGVIGSEIILKDGNKQPPMMDYLGFKDSIARYINMLSKHCGSNFDFPTNQGKAVMILHGCTLLFTPDFFSKYEGFYKYTFLYGEEAILYLMCNYRELKQVYTLETKIFHKEDQSSIMSFQNDKLKMGKYTLQSQKYIIWWEIKNYVRLIKSAYRRLTRAK